MENEFPPNSRESRETRKERTPERDAKPKKEVRQVVTTSVTRRKTPLMRRVIETFTGDANKGVGEYVLMDVLVPGAKDLMFDIGNATLERAFYGGDTPLGGHRRGGRTSYRRPGSMASSRPRGLSSRPEREDRRPAPPQRTTGGPSSHEQIILGSRVEAEETLEQLIELISNYDVATVRDLLTSIGEPHSYTDEDWGWTDLRGSRIHRVGREGYLLDLPRPEKLE